MKMFKLVYKYFVKDICLYVYSVYLHKNCFAFRQNRVIMTAISCFYKVYFSRKWEQILGLFIFLLKMPKGHRFYSGTQVVNF